MMKKLIFAVSLMFSSLASAEQAYPIGQLFKVDVVNKSERRISFAQFPPGREFKCIMRTELEGGGDKEVLLTEMRGSFVNNRVAWLHGRGPSRDYIIPIGGQYMEGYFKVTEPSAVFMTFQNRGRAVTNKITVGCFPHGA